jgi:hypothetical protein
LAEYPAELKDPEGYWGVSNVYFHTIGYNTRLVKTNEVPKTYEDLLLPPVATWWCGEAAALAHAGGLKTRPIACAHKAERAAASPHAHEQAVANRRDIGWPLGISREYSLLGNNAVDHSRPTEQDQKQRSQIPYL